MMKIYLICDEAGSKGFSTNKEKEEGEFGLFAGYFLSESNYLLFGQEFQNISKKYAKPGQKLHITDLDPVMQECLRNDVFNCLRNNNIIIAYEAIYVSGFNNLFEKNNSIKNEVIKDLDTRFSLSSNKENERLHSVLFQALFSKAIAYYIDIYSDVPIIEVIIDNIEDTLKNEFEEKAKELINPFPSTKVIKAFDRIEKQPVSGKISFNSNDLNDDISRTTFYITVIANEYTMIADVLANSINHYLKKAIAKDADAVLNSQKAIGEYPLMNLIYGLSDENYINIVSDILYKRKE